MLLVQGNINLFTNNRYFFKNTGSLQTAHGGIRFLNTAEITYTTQPTRRLEIGIDRHIGKLLFHLGSHIISFITSHPRIVSCIDLNPIPSGFQHFLLTSRNIPCIDTTNQACYFRILTDGYSTFSGTVTLQAFYYVLLCQSGKSETQKE